MSDKYDLDEDMELLCPRCQSINLHHRTVTIWDREDDAEETLTTSVANGNVKQVIVPSEANPSARRDAVTIYFDCEQCGDGLALSIIQHKGTTYTKWHIRQPSYDTEDGL